MKSTIISQWRRPFTQNCELKCLVMCGKAQAICWCDCIISWESPSFMAAQISSNLKLSISCSTLQGRGHGFRKDSFPYLATYFELLLQCPTAQLTSFGWSPRMPGITVQTTKWTSYLGNIIRKWRACLIGTVVGGAKIKTLITWLPGRAHSYLLQYIFYRKTDSRDGSTLDQICFCFVDFPWNMQLL
jgi:hypothetical protein